MAINAKTFARNNKVTMNPLFADIVIDETVDYMNANMVPEGERLVQAEAPHDTGELKRQSFVRARKLGRNAATLEIGSDVPYFRFVVFGTGTRGAGSNREGFPLPTNYKHGPKKGQKANPYAQRILLRLMKKHFKLGAVR